MRAGKSVLLMDGADVYGGAHASCSFAGLLGSQDPELNPHARREEAAGEQQHPALDDARRWLESQGVRVVALDGGGSVAGHLPTQVESFWPAAAPSTAAQESQQQVAQQLRGFILDLAPKVGVHTRAAASAQIHDRRRDAASASQRHGPSIQLRTAQRRWCIRQSR